MQYGLLTYDEGKHEFNIGDYTQSLAAKQFLPKVDHLINREEMAKFNNSKTSIILNGWFCHKPDKWVPSESINPLFVSFHINSTAQEKLLSKDGVKYLKKHEPIGCRDQTTVKILKSHGVDAYFSGCLTLTLDKYKVADSQRSDEIFIVDPFFDYPTIKSLTRDPRSIARGILKGDILKINDKSKMLNLAVDKDLIESARYETQVLPSKTYTDTEKFEIAESLLNKYAKAKLVITSRIHCALPCLALGTPVIFLDAFKNTVDTCRFDGITNLFNIVKFHNDGTITNNFNLEGKITKDTQIKNPEHYKELAEKLKEKCKNFIDREKKENL